MKKWLLVFSVVLVVIAVLGYVFREQIIARVLSPTESAVEQSRNQVDVKIVAENLVTPWSISFLPDGDMLVTQREGQLTRIGENGQSIEIEGVRETSEGGLLGVALDPEFEANQHIYLYYTTDQAGDLSNRIERYRLSGDTLIEQAEIIANIPAASNHNGGAIAFGPDEKLYVTTGDAAEPNLAQDRSSLAGKILRLNKEGSTPSDNPFDNLVWSYGHRNPQGIAWDNDGQLWSVEHGPSGMDELNLITRGGNYGWPEVTGDDQSGGMIAPVVQSGSGDTWAPAGMAYLNGSLYFAGLRGQSLYEADINDSGDGVELSRLYSQEFGRLRAVTSHDGAIYFSTSNRDGRGSPAADDDKIYRMELIN